MHYAPEELIDIRALAQRVGRSVATIRRWERQGLLPVARRDPLTGHRRWTVEQILTVERALARRAQDRWRIPANARGQPPDA